jgi:hypothetical protein
MVSPSPPGLYLHTSIQRVRTEGLILGRDTRTRFEWWPNKPTYLTDFAIHAGDTVALNLTATSLESATFSILNQRTGQIDRATITDEAPRLCGFNAEWIIEDFFASSGVPLVDFGTITFSGTRFVTDTGVQGNVEKARMTGVRESEGEQPVIDCLKMGSEVVGCSYKGPADSSEGVMQ